MKNAVTFCDNSCAPSLSACREAGKVNSAERVVRQWAWVKFNAGYFGSESHRVPGGRSVSANAVVRSLQITPLGSLSLRLAIGRASSNDHTECNEPLELSGRRTHGGTIKDNSTDVYQFRGFRRLTLHND